jgi:CRISPR-associated endonuclease/helicase Cas3
LYNWYQEFYDNETYLEVVKAEFITALKNSVRVIENNIFEPKRINLSKNSEIMLKKHSLRGNSRFVQMAIYDVKNNEVLNEYLSEAITLGMNDIIGRDGVGNLLDFMKKQHHNIIGGSSLKKTKNWEVLDDARDPTTPIYVSYTLADLENIEGDDDAIYYIKGIKQAIGIMAIFKLQNDKK